MPSDECFRAIEDVRVHGLAFFKFISPNDTKATRSHQSGYYLPKEAASIFTPQEPEKGVVDTHEIIVFWHNGSVTNSHIKWYGNLTRNEYRLTTFGRGFEFREPDNIGNLLILIPKLNQSEFIGYVLTNDEDIEEIQASLGIEINDIWFIYDSKLIPAVVSESGCIDKIFKDYLGTLSDFPPTKELSKAAQEALLCCIDNFDLKSRDEKLLELVDQEYALFRIIEEKFCYKKISGHFVNLTEFLDVANTITNRRKSRAGKSLEHQFEYLLTESEVPFESQPAIPGKPDIIIPSKKAYDDPEYPLDKLIHLDIKRTCKDRWRQVLRAAPRIKNKHILTIQQGISLNQLKEMVDQKVSLIVPSRLMAQYPSSSDIEIFCVEEFLEMVKNKL